jgi:hypothetical protein
MYSRLQIAVIATAFASTFHVCAQAPIPRFIPIPAHIELPSAGISIPMRDSGGRPVIELRINGQGPFRFLLDTGAPVSILDADLSRELNLETPRIDQPAPPDGPAPPPIVTIRQIRIGEASVEGLTAILAPPGILFTGDDAPRGVLSAASFPGYLLTYDYPGERVTLRKGALPSADSKRIFQYSDQRDLPTIPIRISGHETEVHLDTGSPFGLTLPSRFLDILPLAEAPRESNKVRTGGGGEFPVTVAKVNGALEIGEFSIDAGRVNFSDAQPGPVPGPPTGNVGYEVLRHFVLTIDSQNGRIQLSQEKAE